VRHALALAVLVVAMPACGGDDDGDERETASPPPPAATAASCRDVQAPEPRPTAALEQPTAILNVEQTYHAVVRTSCGDFTITLDPEASPKAAASFVSLARADFFDRTVFHRIVPGFVIQGGDPTATGTGGPGYTTVDTPAAGTTYTLGTVAMAKTATEPRGAAGSQFFVVTADAVPLPPDYAVIGRVTEGLHVVRRIGVLGDPNTELPTQPVVIDDVVVRVLG
jgi:peptidyl-prolyl cis-trans isomerase B (cyclophilin B)